MIALRLPGATARLVAVLALIVLPLTASAQPPSSDEIRADVAKGEYRTALKKLDTLLFASTPELPSAERYELLMLKGECQLQLQDRLGAMSAFKSAAKAADDVNHLAAAQANVLIIERSSSGRFTPRYGAGKESIDILPAESRKQAMAALQGELASQYKTEIESALRAEQLPPIEQVFARVNDMFFLEIASRGEADETGRVMRELGQRAYTLMQTEVSRSARRVDQLNQIANSASGDVRGWNARRLGLTSQQRDELKAMLPYLTKIRDRARQYRLVAARLGGNEQKWDAMVADTTDALLDAESLSNDR